jgi:hypothetical protein
VSLDADHLRDVDWYVFRLAPHAEQLDLPAHELDLYLWVAAAYAEVTERV